MPKNETPRRPADVARVRDTMQDLAIGRHASVGELAVVDTSDVLDWAMDSALAVHGIRKQAGRRPVTREHLRRAADEAAQRVTKLEAVDYFGPPQAYA
jgi:hypothetical protein